jgi:tol-pal system protein YbgF
MKASGRKAAGDKARPGEPASKPRPKPQSLGGLNEKVDALYDVLFELEERLTLLEARADRKKPSGGEQDTAPAVKKAPDKKKRGAAPAFSGAGPEELYKMARRKLQEKKHDEAMALYKELLARYPEHELADNAGYWIGEIHYDTRRYQNAIFAFQDVVARYPGREKAPDALLKIGYSYESLGDNDLAADFFRRVLDEYPLSTAADKATRKLGEGGGD